MRVVVNDSQALLSQTAYSPRPAAGGHAKVTASGPGLGLGLGLGLGVGLGLGLGLEGLAWSREDTPRSEETG